MSQSRAFRIALVGLIALAVWASSASQPAHAQNLVEAIRALGGLCKQGPRAKGLLTLGTTLDGAGGVAGLTRAAGRAEVALVQIVDGEPVVVGLVPEEGVETLAAMRMQSLAPIAHGDAQMQRFMELGALTWDPRLARARTWLQMPENRRKALLLAGHSHRGVAMRGDGSLVYFEVTVGKKLVDSYLYVKKQTHTTVRDATPADLEPRALEDAERNIAGINELLDRFNRDGAVWTHDRPYVIAPGKGYEETHFPE